MTSATAGCVQNFPKRVFFQPWNSPGLHPQAPQLNEALLQQLGRQGYTHLILQWSRRGEVDFWPADGQGWIRKTLALNQSLQVIHGLYSDPGYFNFLNKTDSQLETELAVIRERSINQAKQLIKQSFAPIAGWYLPEEIDDLNWQTPARRKMLANHFLKTVKELHVLYPAIPVYASTFFSGNQDPVSYAGMLNELFEKTGVIWLVQDGMGVRRANKIDAARYLRSIKLLLPPQAWQGILEIFTEQSRQTVSGLETNYCPASKDKIRGRMETWCEATGKNPEIAFSLAQLQLNIRTPLSAQCKVETPP